ncbi:MAG: exodeoxyribonuclease III [Treponema sp.]|jgi:exodeoxyribonuclease-3|nr:exodeoxyribonuclease III [Treponema sp.]
MRIITWNVNGIRAAQKKGFMRWLVQEQPDILCVQETRAHKEQLDAEILNPCTKSESTYESYWLSAQRAGYAGVALYTLLSPQSVTPLGLYEYDSEGRFLQADFESFSVISVYFPHVQESHKRLDYKIAFCEAVRNRCDYIRSHNRHVILCGDYNIAHNPIDLAQHEKHADDAGYLPEERAWIDSFLHAGYVDSFRFMHPNESGCYSWFSYRSGARQRNRGWRIDYLCVDEELAPSIKKASILAGVCGFDHNPCSIEL